MTKHEGIELEAYWQCNHQFTALDSCKYFGKRLQEEQYSSTKTRSSHPNAPPKVRFFWQKYIESDYFDSIFWSWHDSSIAMIKFDPSRYFWSKMGSLGLVLHKINPLHVKRTTFVWKLIFSHPNEPRKSVFFT